MAFIRKKELRALQERISELETELRNQEEAIADERRIAQSQQALYEKKLHALDEVLEQIQQKKIEVENELLRKKEYETDHLNQYVLAERIRVRDEMITKVKSFSDSYNYYLSQLKLVMEVLTKAAVNTSEVFLTSESTDARPLFRSAVSADLGRAFGKDKPQRLKEDFTIEV